jgi:hypothetical protein
LGRIGSGHGLSPAVARDGKIDNQVAGAGLGGSVPAFENLPVHNEEGAGTHVYIPWWLYKDASKLGFARGYHIEFGTGRRMPGLGTGGASPGYGNQTTAELAARAMALKALAGRCDLDIFIVAQLNRGAYGSTSGPDVSHLAGTSELERFASAVWLIDRPKAGVEVFQQRRNVLLHLIGRHRREFRQALSGQQGGDG